MHRGAELFILLLVNAHNQMTRFSLTFLSSTATTSCTQVCSSPKAAHVPFCEPCPSNGTFAYDPACQACKDCLDGENVRWSNLADALCLSHEQYGLLTGYTFGIVYCVAILAAGRLADSVNRVTILFFSVAGWSVAAALQGMSGTFLELAGARALMGLSQALCGPAAYGLIAVKYAAGERGAANSTYALGVYIGCGLASLGVLLSHAIGWRAASDALAVSGAALACGLLACARDPARPVLCCTRARAVALPGGGAGNAKGRPLLQPIRENGSASGLSLPPVDGGGATLGPVPVGRLTPGMAPPRPRATSLASTDESAVFAGARRPLDPTGLPPPPPPPPPYRARSGRRLHSRRSARGLPVQSSAPKTPRAPPRGPCASCAAGVWSTARGVWEVARSPAPALLILASGIRFVAGLAMGAYIPVLFKRRFPSFNDQFAGQYAVIVTVCGSTSAIAGGYAADRWARTWPAAHAAVPTLCTLVAVVPLYVTCFYGGSGVQTGEREFLVCMGALGATYLLSESWFGSTLAAIQRFAPRGTAGLAVAVQLLVSTAVGNAGPILVGASDPGTTQLREVLFRVSSSSLLLSSLVFVVAVALMHTPTNQAAMEGEDEEEGEGEDVA